VSKLDYPATRRNRAPIWEVLDRVLPDEGAVLEVASGSGQHVAWFAAQRPRLAWQPSSPEAEERASIDAWAGPLANVRPAVALDVRGAWPDARFDAVVCANMVHIAPWEATEALMAGAATVLQRDGVLTLYGPFREGGRHTAPSNEAFDRSLRARDPSWGVRDREAVIAEAVGRGLLLSEAVALPANNQILVFRNTGRRRP